jgi:hypothetical protein
VPPPKQTNICFEPTKDKSVTNNSTDLSEQIEATDQILSNSPAPLYLKTIATHIKVLDRWSERMPIILDSLVAIGRVRALNKEISANV